MILGEVNILYKDTKPGVVPRGGRNPPDSTNKHSERMAGARERKEKNHIYQGSGWVGQIN